MLTVPSENGQSLRIPGRGDSLFFETQQLYAKSVYCLTLGSRRPETLSGLPYSV